MSFVPVSEFTADAEARREQQAEADRRARRERIRQLTQDAEDSLRRPLSKPRPNPRQSRDAVRIRKEQVVRLAADGLSRDEIAERVDLTPQRVSQIVLSFGAEKSA